MKYFEIHYPYYALIKANNEQEAIKKYVKYVADDGGDLQNEITEVSRDYALIKFSRAPGEDKILLPISEVIDEFVEQEHELMIIDGNLL